MMKNRSGLSMISMVVYVVLFFAFSAFAVAIATNMNYRTLAEKGQIINNEHLQKLQYNLISSAKSSDSIENISGKIVFSNNDEYRFSEADKKIYKNGGIIATDVESFRMINVTELDNIPANFAAIVDTDIDHVCIEVKFNKYSQTLTEKLFITVGDGIDA